MNRSQLKTRAVLSTGLGVSQIIAFGTSLYLLAILAKPIQISTGWTLPWITAGMSMGLLVSASMSPWVGRQIARHGGKKKVLVSSSLCFAAGLIVIGLSQAYVFYILGWLLMGLGIASGLYDAVFSCVGKIYGRGARPLISAITIFGGLASTIFWIVGGVLLEKIGWRGVCMTYALFHIAINIPIYLFVLPDANAAASLCETEQKPKADLVRTLDPRLLLIAGLFMAEVFVASIIGVHLIYLLTQMDRSLGGAIAVAAFIGPSQIAGRVLEMTFAARLPVLTTTGLAICAMSAGLLGLAIWPEAAIAAMMVYGAGFGVLSITRGTLPLSLFGHEQYPVLVGRIARPIILTQAAAPTLGAVMIAALSPTAMLLALAFVVSLALLAVLVLGTLKPEK